MLNFSLKKKLLKFTYKTVCYYHFSGPVVFPCLDMRVFIQKSPSGDIEFFPLSFQIAATLRTHPWEDFSGGSHVVFPLHSYSLLLYFIIIVIFKVRSHVDGLVPYQNRGPNTATDLAVVNRTSLRSRPLPCRDQASVCDYQVNKCKRGICEEQSHIKTLCHNSNSLKETHQRKKTSESKNISNVNSGCPVSSN